MIQGKYMFTSARLGFRMLTEDDFGEYFKLDSDPAIREFFPDGILGAEEVKTNIEHNMIFFKKNGFGIFIADYLESGEFVGRCGFGQIHTGEIEVGYVFSKKFWGQGLASEALSALLQWAAQHITVTDTIIAFTPVAHIASQRVMQKVGMDFYKRETQDNQEYLFYKKELRS